MARVIWDTVRIYLEPSQHDAVGCELAGVTRKQRRGGRRRRIRRSVKKRSRKEKEGEGRKTKKHRLKEE